MGGTIINYSRDDAISGVYNREMTIDSCVIFLAMVMVLEGVCRGCNRKSIGGDVDAQE